MSVFQRQAHLTAGTVIDAKNLPHVAVCRTSGVFLSQLRDGFRMCPCQLLHQALPAILALVYGDEAGHTPDHTGKVGILFSTSYRRRPNTMFYGDSFASAFF